MLIKAGIDVISHSPVPRHKIYDMVGRPVKSSNDSLATKRKILSFFGESKCSIGIGLSFIREKWRTLEIFLLSSSISNAT